MTERGDTFEIGPIRPPSEAMSLLIRVHRNCPWNRCTFCPVYKGEKFSLRSREEVLSDIESVGRIADALRATSWRHGLGGFVTPELFHAVAGSAEEGEAVRHVAHWMLCGEQSVFLQDANALIAPVNDLVEILKAIRQRFPGVQRITAYSRSHTITKRSDEDLVRLREAGLDRIHIGLESGSDAVLDLVQKGVKADRHIEAGRRVKSAGIELSEYIMPGLGGRRWSRENAIETARVLNAIDPDFIRVRSLALSPRAPLSRDVEAGRFEPLTDVEVVEELRLLIENLEGISSRVVSDHILNLLEDVAGKLPEDKCEMLAAIDFFLSLPEDEREVFQLGRRLGLFRRPADIGRSHRTSEVRAMLGEIREGYGSLEAGLREIAKQFI